MLKTFDWLDVGLFVGFLIAMVLLFLGIVPAIQQQHAWDLIILLVSFLTGKQVPSKID